MDPIRRYSEFLVRNAEMISKEIVDYNLAQLEIELPQEIIEKSIQTNIEFLEFLGNSLNLSNETVREKFIEWHKERSDQTAYDFSFNDIASLIKPYADTRLHLTEMLTKISMREGLSIDEIVQVNNRLSYLMDLSITETMIERERLANQNNKENQRIITELSSPIVPIQNGLAILPLIGEIDLDRNDHIINNVIPKISELNINSIIIDFSGIPKIDIDVARRIFKIKDVLGLIGVNTMFTGIRPDLAVNIMSAGIDFSSIQTFGTVQQALQNMRD